MHVIALVVAAIVTIGATLGAGQHSTAAAHPATATVSTADRTAAAEHRLRRWPRLEPKRGTHGRTWNGEETARLFRARPMGAFGVC